MLFTSLGYPEDVANLQPLMQAAEKAGFDVVYADLPDVELYKDEDDDLYQPSVFMVDGRPSCLSFRRGEKLIIDDDAQFIPHIITS